MDTTELTKDTVLCMSLAARPTSIGTRFHNYLYRELDLNYIYKAFTTTDIEAAVGGIRALGIRGCAISMPFKEAVIPLMDELDPSATAIESVNTIVNTDGRLKAYNTDYLAVASCIADIDTALPFAVIGSGGMAKAVVAALRDAGFRDGTVIARNEATGSALAGKYGYQWRATATDQPGLIVNATPIGMFGGPEERDLPLPPHLIDAASNVIEVVAVPVETPLVARARASGIPVVTGAQIMALQAAEQFVLYTGVRPSPDQIARATAYSRSA